MFWPQKKFLFIGDYFVPDIYVPLGGSGYSKLCDVNSRKIKRRNDSEQLCGDMPESIKEAIISIYKDDYMLEAYMDNRWHI